MPADADASSALDGAFIADLLLDRRWLVRRVETWRIVDEVTIQRRITLDVDLSAVRAAYVRAYAMEPSGVVWIPLCLIRKQLLLDIDLTDDAGRRLHVGSRRVDRRLAAAALSDLHSRPTASVVPLCERLVDFSAADWPQSAELLTDSGLPPAVDDLFGSLDISAESPPFQFWAATFASRFLLPVQVGLEAGGVVVFKLVLLEAISRDESVGAWRPNEPRTFDLPLTDVAWCDSNHIRIEGPPGLMLTSMQVLQVNEERGAELGRYWGRLTPYRAHLYTWGPGLRADRGHGDDGQQLICQLTMRLLPRGFLATARGALFLIGAVLAAGAYYLTPFIEREGAGNADAAVALLLVVPSTVVAYLFQREEHPLFRQAARLLRLVIIAAALAPLVAGSAYLVMRDSDDLRVVWLLLSLFVFCVESVTLRVYETSSERFRRVADSARLTIDGRMVADDLSDLLRELANEHGLREVATLLRTDLNTVLGLLSTDARAFPRSIRTRLTRIAQALEALDDPGATRLGAD